MDAQVLDYLINERIAVLTVLLPDGTLHGATLHYSHVVEPDLRIFFSVNNDHRKSGFMKDSMSTKAAVVIGFSEDEWKTMQLDGTVRVLGDEKDVLLAKSVHYVKHPNSRKYENDPKAVFFEFTPDWYRYTDFMEDPVLFIEG